MEKSENSKLIDFFVIYVITHHSIFKVQIEWWASHKCIFTTYPAQNQSIEIEFPHHTLDC